MTSPTASPTLDLAKSPFDYECDPKLESKSGAPSEASAADATADAAAAAAGHAGEAAERRPSLLLVVQLSQGLSAALSQLSEGPLGREAAAKAFADDHDTVTESGKALWWEVAAHLLTCMFGAGVLGLPYALASQGWFLGLAMLLLAIGTSAYSAFMLAELHVLRDGRRVRTLRALGEAIWGMRGRRVITWLQVVDLVGGALIFTVAGGTSLMDIVHGCYGEKGAACDAHAYSTWPWVLCFGGAMILLSQLKDFHSLTVVSLIGSVMPLLYAGIAFVSVLVKGPAPDVQYGMIQKGSTVSTVMNVFSGIGAMAYAFGGQVVQNEVTSMLRTPPAVVVSARKALTLCYAILAVGYLAVATSGYAVFGVAVTGNILQSVPYAAPAIVANVGVLLHVGAAYQAYSMSVYQMIEQQVEKRKWLPPAVARRPWAFRLVVRTGFVCLITFFAALIPFFNQLSGLKGGLCMVPLCFIAPIAMWQWYNRDVAGRARAALNWTLIAIFSAIAVVATTGSIYKIINSASTFKLFA